MDDRKLEILNATRNLINDKGLSDTSTNDIASEVGISRGTLYHHFESKEAILDALVDQVGSEIYARARATAQDKSVGVVKRFIQTILSLNIGEGPDHVILNHLNSPKNILLHQKVQKEMLATLPEILTPIIEEGIEEGIFDTKYAYECMEMLIAYVSLVFDNEDGERCQEENLYKLLGLTCNLERMLGAQEGTFKNYLDNIAL